MWLVSCRGQGMLTQGPAPDSSCELNIAFLALPHPLHCPICAKGIMVTVLLLQVMGGWEGWGGVGGWGGGSFILGFGLGDRGWVSYFFYFLFCFFEFAKLRACVLVWFACLSAFVLGVLVCVRVCLL